METDDSITWVGELVAFVADDELAAMAARAIGGGTQAAAAIVSTLRLQAQRCCRRVGQPPVADALHLSRSAVRMGWRCD